MSTASRVVVCCHCPAQVEFVEKVYTMAGKTQRVVVVAKGDRTRPSSAEENAGPEGGRVK